jgi:signal transduction histidine kinase
MPSDRHAEELARACVAARNELRRASRVLHDEIGSTLAVAGLQLQLLRMDHPEMQERSAELSQALDSVMESVRRLSREVDPSPAGRTGLKNALLDLAEKHMEAFEGGVIVRCTVSATLPHHVWDALYLTAARAVEVAAARGARRVVISAAGAKAVSIRIAHSGNPNVTRRDLQSTALLARAAGLKFDFEPGTHKTEKSTIVVIRYAVQRSTSRRS